MSEVVKFEDIIKKTSKSTDNNNQNSQTESGISTKVESSSSVLTSELNQNQIIEDSETMVQFHFCRCKTEWFVKDGLGMTCSGITYCLIIFAEFVVIGVILLPGFPLSVWSYVHAIIFSLLAFLAACSHLRAMTTNPVCVLYFYFIKQLEQNPYFCSLNYYTILTR